MIYYIHITNMRSRYIRMILKSLVIHITIVKSTKIFSLDIIIIYILKIIKMMNFKWTKQSKLLTHTRCTHTYTHTHTCTHTACAQTDTHTHRHTLHSQLHSYTHVYSRMHTHTQHITDKHTHRYTQ